MRTRRECLYCHERAIVIRHTEDMGTQVVRYVRCDQCRRQYTIRTTVTVEKVIGFQVGRKRSSDAG